MEGSGRGLISGIIPDFAWRERGKFIKPSIEITGFRAKICTFLSTVMPDEFMRILNVGLEHGLRSPSSMLSDYFGLFCLP